MITYFSRWGQVWIATFRQLLHAFPHLSSVFSLSSMLNQTSTRFLPLFRHLQKGQSVRLPEKKVLWGDINIQCNLWMKDMTVISHIPQLEWLISHFYEWSMGLCTILPRYHGHLAHSGSCPIRLTGMVSVCLLWRLFNAMHEEIIATIHWSLMSVCSGCLNFVMRVVQASV